MQKVPLVSLMHKVRMHIVCTGIHGNLAKMREYGPFVNGCIFWFLKLAVFFILPVFRDPILSTLYLLFVSEEELYLFEMLVVISVIGSFSCSV